MEAPFGLDVLPVIKLEDYHLEEAWQRLEQTLSHHDVRIRLKTLQAILHEVECRSLSKLLT
jgi:hypothetical protein